MTRTPAQLRTALLAAALLATTSLPTFADSSWLTDANANWSDPTNWSTNPLYPNGQDINALLGNVTSTRRTISLTSNITLGSLTIDSPYGYTLSGTSSLTLSTSTGNASITVNTTTGSNNNTISAPLTLASPTVITNNATPTSTSAQNYLILSGALSGSAPLTLAGPGQVVLYGNNSNYTGPISINNGTLVADSSTSLGSSTSAADGTTINSGGTLVVSHPLAVANESITLNGGTLKSNTVVTLNNPLSVTADSLITGTNPYASVKLNSITGSANLSLSTTNFTLAGNTASNIFNGTINLTSGAAANITGSLPNAQFILNPGTSITLARPVGTTVGTSSVAPGSISATGGAIGASADIDFRPALSANSTLSGILFNTANATLAGTNSLDMNAFANPSTLRIGGTGSIASTMDIRPDTATHTFRFGNANSSLTVYATLADHDSAPANLDLNAGAITLAAANTFTGITTITNGTLFVKSPNALGSASGTDADGTIINANASLSLSPNVTLSGEKVTVNPGGFIGASGANAVYANPITMNGGTITNGIYTGTISGAGNFNVNGATLSGTGTYTGNLTFIGNATITSANALSTTSNTTLAAGIVTLGLPISQPLQVNGGTLLVAPGVTLSASNITVSSGTLSGGATSVYANPITMNGGGLSSATFSGQLAGSGNFTVSYAAVLAGTGTYTGTATFTGDATITSPNALSPAGTTVVQKGNISINAPLSVPLTIAYFSGTGLSSNVTVNGPISAPIVMNDGTLNVNAVTSQPITVNSGFAYINVPSASTLFITGSPPPYDGSLVYPHSILTLNAAGSAPISVNGGTLQLADLHHPQTGAISINNGNLIQWAAGNISLAAPVHIAGNVTIGTSSFYNNSNLSFTNPISASGYLTLSPGDGNQSLSGLINFASTLSYTGLLSVNTAQQTQMVNFSAVNSTGAMLLNGYANFAGNVSHQGDLLIGSGSVTLSGSSTQITGTLYDAGNLTVNSNLTVPHLSVVGGLLGNGTITTGDGQLTLLSGNLGFTGVLNGITAINVNTLSSASLSAMPAGFSGVIAVQSGQLQLPSTLPLNTVPINLSGASTVTLNTGTYSNPISLNNSNGAAGSPALTINETVYLGNTTLTAPVSLGSTGSSIGIPAGTTGNYPLTITGPLSGGNLTVQPGLCLTLTSANNTYTGTTTIFGTFIGTATVFGNSTSPSNLSLSGSGAIHSTSQISLNGYAQLLLNNSSTNVSDRLPDTAPILSNGATIEMDGSLTSGVTSTETVGPVTFVSGENTVKSVLNNSSTTNILTIASIARDTGATVDFNSGITNNLGTSSTNAPRIMITGQSSTNFLGAPYTENLVNFAKYTSNGITAMTAADYFTGPESSWTASTIVSLSSAVSLSASRSVLAVKPDVAYNTNAAINLGNNTLNVVSGGILGGLPFSGSQGNHLTAGGNAPTAELLLINYGGTLPVNITDNPGPDGQYDPTPSGPLDKDNGAVSLVFSAGPSGHYLTLTGTNTYTGTTFVNGGILIFASPASLPHGNFVLNGGAIRLGSNFAAVVSTFTLHDGIVGLDPNQGSLNATSYNLESGQVNIPITGSGPLTKSTLGTVSLTSINGFTGPITVNAGLLTAFLTSGQVFSNPLTIQNGTFKVSLSSGTASWRGPITLGSNGTLSFSTGIHDFAPASTSISPGATFLIAGINSGVNVTASTDPFTDSANPSVHANVINNGSFNVTTGAVQLAILSGSGGTSVSTGASLTCGSLFQSGVGGTVTIRPAATSGTVSVLGNFVFNATSLFDLNNTDLIVRSTDGDMGDIQTAIQKAFHNGDWNGTGGITSSTAKAALASSHPTGLATFTGAQYAAATGNLLFDGQTFSTTDILIKYALLGDTNADGSVTLADLATVYNNYGKTTPNWTDGNFDYAPAIDLTDLQDVLAPLGYHPTTETEALADAQSLLAAAPEPASLSLLAALPVLLLRRKQSRSND